MDLEHCLRWLHFEPTHLLCYAGYTSSLPTYCATLATLRAYSPTVLRWLHFEPTHLVLAPTTLGVPRRYFHCARAILRTADQAEVLGKGMLDERIGEAFVLRDEVCMMYGVRCMVYMMYGVYGVWCMVFGVRCMSIMHSVWCMVYMVCVWRIVYVAYGVWCMMHGVWCMVYGVWCMVYTMHASTPPARMRPSLCPPVPSSAPPPR
jgi:hypothetical protein